MQPHLDPELPHVLCDAAQIEQVLLALMMNAIDAMPQGGNLWLTTDVNGEDGRVRVVVRDDGSGIPPEILPRILMSSSATSHLFSAMRVKASLALSAVPIS